MTRKPSRVGDLVFGMAWGFISA